MGVGVVRLEPADVERVAVNALVLGVDDVDLMSPEALAASLRRAASVLCPTTTGALIRALNEVLSGLPGFTDEVQVGMEFRVESLIAYGDLLDLPILAGTRNSRQLFLGPPAFIPRATNNALLVGIRPDGVPLVSDHLLGQIDYRGHARLLRSPDDRTVADLLRPEGLFELKAENWLDTPREATPEETLAFYVARLEASGSSGDIEGLRVIDPAAKVTYYKGRWRPINSRDGGRFVGRRPQAFGADLWCFAEVVGGSVARLIDLPLQASLARGADEAWRLQAAMDVMADNPQRIRIGEVDSDSVIAFFSPVPSWIQRRLDIVGRPLGGITGALFSYALPHDELAEELRVLRQMMWLSPETAATGDDDGR